MFLLLLGKVIQLQGMISKDCLLSVTRRRPSVLSLISCTGKLDVGTVTHTFNMCGRRLKVSLWDTIYQRSNSSTVVRWAYKLMTCSHAWASAPSLMYNANVATRIINLLYSVLLFFVICNHNIISMHGTCMLMIANHKHTLLQSKSVEYNFI